MNESRLFDVEPAWTEHWLGMPEYCQEDLMPWHSIKVHFRNAADRQAFSELVGQRVHRKTKWIWFPEAEIGRFADKRYAAREKVSPRYPVYVISKGRWESRLTVKALEKIGVPFRIVVEPQEYESYAAVIAPEKILTLPFSNLGQGSIPARNRVWEHAVGSGAERHWILDDNIGGFYRLNRNLKTPVGDGTIFLCRGRLYGPLRERRAVRVQLFHVRKAQGRDSALCAQHAGLLLHPAPQRFAVPLAGALQRGHRPVVAHPQSRLLHDSVQRFSR